MKSRLMQIQKMLSNMVNKKEEKAPEDLEERVVDFFSNADGPIDDEAFHEFAEMNGVDPDQAEGIVYGLLQSVLQGGKSKGQEFEYDENEMEIGMEEEREHSDNEFIRHKIVLDHLKKDPEFYSKEKEAQL